MTTETMSEIERLTALVAQLAEVQLRTINAESKVGDGGPPERRQRSDNTAVSLRTFNGTESAMDTELWLEQLKCARKDGEWSGAYMYEKRGFP